jgi:ribose transport system ATP-binding protein
MSEQYQVEMLGICKSFGGVDALKSVDFRVRPGEIHALMGENGAGKSTLIKILAGACLKDSGEIFIKGKKVNITDPRAGINHGISVIYQEFALVGDLSVAENIFIDNLTEGKKMIDWKQLNKRAEKLLEKLGFGNIDVNIIVSELSVAHQQVVEICKAISRNSFILVLDEPTSVLTSNEVEQLFELLLALKENGVSIIYISHRLEEVFRISDRITVLKDGTFVATVDTASINEKQLVNMMIGRELRDFFPPRNATIGEPILEVKGINCGNSVKDISFRVNEGEVLGIGGLVGSGRTETARAIFGADKKDSGKVYLFGKPVNIKSPRNAIKLGIGLLPEDRKRHGVLLELPIRYNTTLSSLEDFCGPLAWINKQKEIDFLNKMVQMLAIKAASIEDNVSSLSGGNQQKVAISKLLASDCKVLILDEPTRGVDVGAKIEIYKIINSLAEKGCAIIIISSEMTEIIGMCDRALIMREGSIVGELKKDALTEQNFIKYSMGVK